MSPLWANQPSSIIVSMWVFLNYHYYYFLTKDDRKCKIMFTAETRTLHINKRPQPFFSPSKSDIKSDEESWDYQHYSYHACVEKHLYPNSVLTLCDSSMSAATHMPAPTEESGGLTTRWPQRSNTH